MPFVVKSGEVHDGERVYREGDVLPDGVGDEAMVAEGAVEWREPKPEPIATPAKRRAVKS